MEAICDISLKVWLTNKEAELYTGYGKETLRLAREDGNLTFYRKKDAHRTSIRYRREDLDRFMLHEHEECKAYGEMPFSRRTKTKQQLIHN
jgi:hypothetical protein